MHSSASACCPGSHVATAAMPIVERRPPATPMTADGINIPACISQSYSIGSGPIGAWRIADVVDDGQVPEGDTVFALARRLDAALRGRVLTQGELRVPRHATADLSERTVLEHDTHGKHLLTRLSGDLTLHTHLRMQGSWTISKNGKWLPRTVMPDVRVVLRTDGPAAYGVKLPVVELLRTRDEADAVGYLGPDPLRPDWDAAEAVRRMSARPDRPLVAVLLDQRCVAGFGNLWANELCFLRGHYPWTPVGDVDLSAIVALGARALKHSATVPGAMQITTGNRKPGEQHWVSGRAGRRCLRCGTTILVVDEVPGDPERRRTWWCPHCQPEG